MARKLMHTTFRSPIAPASLLAALAACSGSTGGSGAANPTAEEAPRPPLVEVQRLEERPVRRFIETTSYLESEHRVVVLPKVTGRIDEVVVDEGMDVQKGDLLARLDDREARAATRQVEVQLAQQGVQLELMRLEQSAWDRRIEQSRIERDKARSQHERNLNIEKDLISEKELEDSRYTLESAEEALLVAQFDKQKAALEVQVARNQIEELDARLEAERIRLSDHRIVAPIDGVVEARLVRGGETVGAATELFVVVDDDNLVSYLRRPQRELAALRDATDVTFTTDAVQDHEFGAVIDVVSPVVDQATGSFSIRVRVIADDAQAGVLRPGMFIRARILTEEERPALMVPKAAILNEGTASTVFVARDGVAHRIVITTGLEERDFIEATNRGEDGLQPGDLLIVSGQQGLRDKTAVEVAAK